MDNTKEMLIAIRKYEKSYTLLVKYFEGIGVKESTLEGVKLQLLKPHLIKFLEAQGVNFLDALIYTNFNRFTPEHKELEDKTIVVCFHKVERGAPNDFDVF